MGVASVSGGFCARRAGSLGPCSPWLDPWGVSKLAGYGLASRYGRPIAHPGRSSRCGHLGQRPHRRGLLVRLQQAAKHASGITGH